MEFEKKCCCIFWSADKHLFDEKKYQNHTFEFVENENGFKGPFVFYLGCQKIVI